MFDVMIVTLIVGSMALCFGMFMSAIKLVAEIVKLLPISEKVKIKAEAVSSAIKI